MSSESKVRVGFYEEQCYEGWRMQMQGVLETLNLWKIVNGDIPCPVADTSGDANSIKNLERWMMADNKAKKIILARVNEPGRNQVKDCKTSNEIWLKLKEIMESRAPDMKILFMKKLLSLRLNDGQDVNTHVQEFCHTVDKLTKMEVAINEHFLCTLLLKSLPNSFQSFRREMESMDEFPPLEDLARKIIEEGMKKKDFETAKDTMKIESVIAFKDSTTPNAPEDKPFCPVGDITSNVFKKIDGRICWLLDTKLPYHCCDEALLPRIAPAVRAEYIIKEGPDWILNSGTINICSQYSDRSLTIHDILCVQGFDLNILSVSKIAKMGYEVNFESKIARIVDKKGRTILTAYRIGDKYWIIEDLYKEQAFPYVDAKPAEETSGIFNCLTKWLGWSSSCYSMDYSAKKPY